jgi:CheY-like chemotaxis protein
MKPRNILVIDDSTLIHKLFGMLFPSTPVAFAASGVEALQRLAQIPDVDLIFLDINMPKMSGLEVLDKIKANADLAAIPIVIISTEGKEHDVIRGLQAGAAAYVKKPFRNEEILALVPRLMENYKPAGAAANGGSAGPGTTSQATPPTAPS